MAPPTKTSQEHYSILLHAVHDLAKKVEDLRESQRSFVTIDQLTKALEPINKALNELIKLRGDDQDCPLVNDSQENLQDDDDNKIEIPEFDGELELDAIQDWIVHVESVLAHKDMTDADKVSSVANQLRGPAAIWWNQVEGGKCMQNLYPITTWAGMKQLLKLRFLPLSYGRDLARRCLGVKQGSKTVSEYTEDFRIMTTRAERAEDEEHTVEVYICGLGEDVRLGLPFQYFDTVTEAYQHALKVEETQNYEVLGHDIDAWTNQTIQT